MKSKISGLIIFLIGCMVCFYSQPINAQDVKGLPKTVSIATHPKGSLMNFIGGGFSKVITSHLPIKATDRPFTGYMAWVPLMDAGELDMGIVTSPESYTAYMGQGPYKQPLKSLRLISSGASVLLSYVVRADSNAKTMADLKGKRIAIDRASYVTKIENETSIIAAGLDLKKDIVAVPVAGVAELMYSIMDGRADAGWGSVGSSQVKEVAGRVGGVRWISLCASPDDDAAKLIKEKVAGSRIVRIKAGQDPDVKNDAWIMETPIYLATHKGFNDEAVYLIAKAAWQNQKELEAIHPIFKEWTPKNAVLPDVAIPYHPGAIRFYKEVGAWSAEMDQTQKMLLSR
jgi:TRAP transporter TAXI family solute receptor